MITDKQLADQVHMLVHSLRLIPGYKPSNAEVKLSKLVIDRFKDDCPECKDAEQRIQNHKPEKGFMAKLGDVLNGND